MIVINVARIYPLSTVPGYLAGSPKHGPERAQRLPNAGTVPRQQFAIDEVDQTGEVRLQRR
jgi:hypothetical protein